MFCPSCDVFLEEKHLIKTAIKKYKETVVAYDATCPYCKELIGSMFWGELTPLPRYVRAARLPYQEPSAWKTPPEAENPRSSGG